MAFAGLKGKLRLGLMAIVVLSMIACVVSPAHATDDMTTSIQQWLPTIISFAMLGMVLKLLRGFTGGRR